MKKCSGLKQIHATLTGIRKESAASMRKKIGRGLKKKNAAVKRIRKTSVTESRTVGQQRCCVLFEEPKTVDHKSLLLQLVIHTEMLQSRNKTADSNMMIIMLIYNSISHRF